MAMSRTRHLVWPTQSDARNSCADENARAAKPNSFSKSGSDSRTDSSSSTTDTSERVTFIDFLAASVAAGVSECRDCSRQPSKLSGPQGMANENATWRPSMSQGCATPVESAIVLWYWLGADINTSSADEDDRHLLKMLLSWISHAASVSATAGVRVSGLLSAPVTPSGPRGIENENVAPGP